MITPFDIGCFLAILLAMLLSHQPKRGVAAFVALIQLSIMLIDYKLIGGWIQYYLVSIVESIGAALIIFVQGMQELKQKLHISV